MVGALKAVVVIMGLLIVLGTGTLVYLLASGLRATPQPASSIALPPGAAVAEMVGLGDRLALHLKQPGAPDRILIVDPARGRVVGTITLEAKE